MKYIQERISSTDTHTFLAKPSEGILTLMKSYDGKKPVDSFEHGWWASRGYTNVADLNATYFGSHIVGGMIVDSGIEVSHFLADKKFITLIYKDGKLTLDEEYRSDVLKVKYTGYNFMVQLGDPLVKNGINYKGDGQFDHTNSRNPRSFIGQNGDGEIIFFATDGRTDRGFTRDELAVIALDMDCVTAVMCDGGGSSTLVIEDKMVNDNEDRIVPSVFMFYAKDYTLERETIGNDSSIPSGPIIEGYNFTWREVQSEVPDSMYKLLDVMQYISNIILLTCMLQIYRTWLNLPIKIEHWFRPKAYYQSLIDRGYPAARGSDHEQARAVDTNVRPTLRNIAKWKSICRLFNVYYSIGIYSWGVHLGFRYDKANEWDYRQRG